MSSPVSASAGGRFPLSVHSLVAQFVPQPLIRSSPVTRLQPFQLLVPQPRLPGSLPSRDRLAATWLPSPFLPGPTTRPEGLLADGSFPSRIRFHLVNSVGPPILRHPLLAATVSAPFLEFRLACAFRYSGSLHHLKIAGQGVFLKSQGYPQTFLTIPRSFSTVHVLHTGFAQRSR